MKLIDKGADIYMQDINGETVLHYAARAKNVTMIKWICKRCNLTQTEIQAFCSMRNCRKQYPEDVTSNVLCKQLLSDYRQYGCRIKEIEQQQ